jgi:hypothetical protein
MAISDIISIVLSPNSRTPTRQGFGNCLYLANHSHNVDLYRIYEDEAEMLADGFTDLERAYLGVQAMFQQNPRPPRVLVGRLPTASTQSLTVTALTAVEGAVVSVEVQGDDGVWVECAYTVGAAETTTTVAAALELLIEAVPGASSTAAVAVVTVTPAVNTAPVALRNAVNCAIKDNSSDSGYAAALTAIMAQTKDFYFVTTDHNSETIADAVAAWAQSNKRMYITQSNDTIEASGSGVFGSGQKAASYTYSAGIFAYDMTEYPACAMAALGAVRDPGSFTWHLKALEGVTTIELTSTQQNNLETAGWNYYVEVANGINGIMANNGSKKGGGISFGGRFLDLTHGTDWLSARMSEGLFGTIANADKIDYEDPGALVLATKLKSIMKQGEANRLLRKGSSSVTYTPVADTDEDDRANRYYPYLKASAIYSGAIHAARITVSLAE